MSNIVKNYFKILKVISSLNIVLNTENRAGRRLKIPDLEIVALSLTSEYMSIDSEIHYSINCKMGKLRI